MADAARPGAGPTGCRAAGSGGSAASRPGWLLAIGAGLAALSVWALHERSVAASKTRIARSEVLAADSRSQLDADAERSVLLALSAIREHRTPAAEDALRDALRVSRVRVALHGHRGALTSGGFSPDGKRVVTAGQNGTARVWDASSGRSLEVLAAQDRPFGSMSTYPTGSH